ncbi:hypothetical protein [Actimicrobium sp. CCI2.3]|uniref:hypothetical protein n=1 Tax=Actimicrobium sp. CCI2.3 TaxID=3048616 RepID=UPI002AB49D28|nr:hypothetical protein [Actimicrobium sp. CCI2.3]MDY7573938.1 hypothetical protein [Actimicrobium sp. CCI2.3]MEB0023070.1 hypothetical protein [Actimicrobium sp. CCI2.3]
MEEISKTMRLDAFQWRLKSDCRTSIAGTGFSFLSGDYCDAASCRFRKLVPSLALTHHLRGRYRIALSGECCGPYFSPRLCDFCSFFALSFHHPDDVPCGSAETNGTSTSCLASLLFPLVVTPVTATEMAGFLLLIPVYELKLWQLEWLNTIGRG